MRSLGFHEWPLNGLRSSSHVLVSENSLLGNQFSATFPYILVKLLGVICCCL